MIDRWEHKSPSDDLRLNQKSAGIDIFHDVTGTTSMYVKVYGLFKALM